MEQTEQISNSSRISRPQLLLFLLTRFLLNVNNRMIYPFLPQFSSGLGVTPVQLSHCISLRSALTAADPLFSSLSDRWGRRPVILGCMFLILSGLAVFLLHSTFFTFGLYLCISYLGVFTAMSALQAYIADKESAARSSRYISILELGWSTSFLLGMPLTALLITRVNWKAPLYIIGICLTVITVLLIFAVWEDRAQLTHAERSQLASPIQHIAMVLRSRNALAVFGLFFSLMIPSELVLVTFSTWLEDAFQVEIMSLGVSSFLIGFAELAGELLAIQMSGRIDRWKGLKFVLVLNGVVACMIPILGSSMTGAVLSLPLFFITTEFLYISAIPVTVEVMPSARATMLGINGAVIALGRALADFIAPYLISFGLLWVIAVCLLADIAALCIIGYMRKGLVPLLEKDDDFPSERKSSQ